MKFKKILEDINFDSAETNIFVIVGKINIEYALSKDDRYKLV